MRGKWWDGWFYYRCDQQFDALILPVTPSWANNWNDFQDHFKAHWLDHHEAHKAQDHIMSGAITQCTSIQVYNNLFNDTLSLVGKPGLICPSSVDISMA